MDSIQANEVQSLLSSDNDKEREKGLKMLKEQMFGLITSMIMKGGSSKEDAEEIFWDGLLVIDVEAKKKRFGPSDNVPGFLKNVCRNIWLKKQRKKTLKFNNIDDHIDFITEHNVAIPSLVEDETAKRLELVIQQLKPKCQSILRLAFFEGLTPHEIKEWLDLKSEDVVKTSKSRCKKKLREIIDSFGGKGFFNL